MSGVRGVRGVKGVSGGRGVGGVRGVRRQEGSRIRAGGILRTIRGSSDGPLEDTLLVALLNPDGMGDGTGRDEAGRDGTGWDGMFTSLKGG